MSVIQLYIVLSFFLQIKVYKWFWTILLQHITLDGLAAESKSISSSIFLYL